MSCAVLLIDYKQERPTSDGSEIRQEPVDMANVE